MRRLFCTVPILVCLALLVPSSPTLAQADGFRASTQKYREKNPAGAKGRAGGATMAARLLYAKDGSTLLEATTGELDDPGATPTGEFTRVKAIAYDANGVEMFTFNYPTEGGSYFQTTLAGLSPGQPFGLQGHIRTHARKNTPVTITTSVQKRPDLAAQRIVVPARVPLNIPVQVVAVVAELNAYMGARTDCVLYANDVEIDRGRSIWVDSGDSVSCAFSPTFSTAGPVALKVSVEGVTPGDWDVANNSVERQVEVADLTLFDLAYVEAAVSDVDNTTFQQVGRYLNSTLNAGYDWGYEETVDRSSDAFVYAARTLGVSAVPTHITAHVTDGMADWTLDRSIPACGNYATAPVNGRTFYSYVTGCGNLYVQLGSYAGTVTYASRLLTRTFTMVDGAAVYDGPAQWVFNNVSTDVEYGETLMKGDIWAIDVSVTAGSSTYGTPVSVWLTQAIDAGNTEPYACESSAVATWCSSSSWQLRTREGSATVTPPQP